MRGAYILSTRLEEWILYWRPSKPSLWYSTQRPLKQRPCVDKTSKTRDKQGRQFRRVKTEKYPPLRFLHPWCGPPLRCDQPPHSLGWTSLHQAKANRKEELRSDSLPANPASNVLSDPPHPAHRRGLYQETQNEKVCLSLTRSHLLIFISMTLGGGSKRI